MIGLAVVVMMGCLECHFAQWLSCFTSEHRCPFVGRRFLVEDGASVPAGHPYAEVEVMKMYMTLQVPEAGKIHFCKLEGSMLESGELIATVTLDDPSKVHKVRKMGSVERVLA